jgi:hypothetical protein
MPPTKYTRSLHRTGKAASRVWVEDLPNRSHYAIQLRQHVIPFIRRGGEVVAMNLVEMGED